MPEPDHFKPIPFTSFWPFISFFGISLPPSFLKTPLDTPFVLRGIWILNEFRKRLSSRKGWVSTSFSWNFTQDARVSVIHRWSATGACEECPPRCHTVDGVKLIRWLQQLRYGMQVDKVKKLNFTCDLADNSKIEANCNQTLFSSFSTSYFFPFTTFFKSYFRARI